MGPVWLEGRFEMKWILLTLLGLMALFAVYVRLAPTDVARWHKPADPQPIGDYPAEGSHMVVLEATAQDFAALDAIIRSSPRTHVLAGSVEAGIVTYVTRSALWGFPDYTTVSLGEDGVMQVYGRLRFGRSDLGVNRKRIEGWLAQWQQDRPTA